MAVITGFSTFTSSAPQQDVSITRIESPLVEQVEKQSTTKEKVEAYFEDIPILIDIARCESHFRQSDSKGNLIRGKVNRYDVGVMQINELYHLEKAEELGLDIHSLEGNLSFARYLYDREGARPWLSSSKCWASYHDIALK